MGQDRPVDWFGTPMEPLAGGYSGETFLVGAAEDQVVLRIYARDPERCVVDASLLRLLHGVVPVPALVDERPAADGQPGVLVMELLPGERLDLVLPTASDRLRTTIAGNLGRLLATLSGIPMLRFGMFQGAELRISDAGGPAEDLRTWAHHFRDNGRLAAWEERDFDGLLELVDEAAGRLRGSWRDEPPKRSDPALTRVVLAHSDFNPKNLLVDAETGEITGLLDWEFAHAGSPYTDLGNLTRFERHPDVVAGVLMTLREHAPTLAADPLILGRAVDLWALIELAGNPQRNAVRELATQLLLAQARSGDLLAWPWETPRVDP